jgi:serine/threonine protein kinase
MKNRLDLSDFNILKEFKGNSCNKIYLVNHPNDDTPYIFKVIKIYNFQSQLREIQAQKNLKHNYIIRLLDYEIQKESIVLLIEYAEKGDLFEFINTIESIRESKLLRLFYKIVVAVHFIHLNGFIHRDIKPENILIGGDNEPKLADFGSSVSEEIVRNTFCGTYEYMAPEIYMRKKQTAKVDSWALGVLLYEMTHNNTPFKNKDVSEIQHIVENDLINFDDQISMKIRNIIRNILKFDSRRRPTTAQILKFPELKRFYNEMKPDLLSMYQDNKIAKIRKIKSMNNGFKMESQYRHMQTTNNLDETEQKQMNHKKKTSNDLKRYSKDLSDSFFKNKLKSENQSNANKEPVKKFDKKNKPVFGGTSIQEFPINEKTSGLDMRGRQSPREEEPADAYRVSIHNDRLNQEKTSLEQIDAMVNDVPHRNEEPEILPESHLFKQQFMTSQYDKRDQNGKSKQTSLSSKKRIKQGYISNNLYSNMKEKLALGNGSHASGNLLSNVKLDSNKISGSKLSKKVQNRSITKKIRSLFEKQPNILKKHKLKPGLYKMNTESNYQSAMFVKPNTQSKKNQNFKNSSKITPKKEGSYSGAAHRIEHTKFSSKALNKNLGERKAMTPVKTKTRKKNFKVDSKHFKDFEKKFALKFGGSNKKGTKSYRELGMNVIGAKQEKPRYSGAEGGLIESNKLNSLIDRFGNSNHIPSSKKKKAFMLKSNQKGNGSNYSSSKNSSKLGGSAKKVQDSSFKNFSGSKQANGPFSYSRNLYSKYKSNYRSNNNFSHIMMTPSNLANKYSLSKKMQLLSNQKISSNRNVNLSQPMSRGKSLISKFNSQKSSTKDSQRSKKIKLRNEKGRKEDKDSTNDPGSKKQVSKFPVSFSALRKNYSLVSEVCEVGDSRAFGFGGQKGLSTEELFRPDQEKGYFSQNFY